MLLKLRGEQSLKIVVEARGNVIVGSEGLSLIISEVNNSISSSSFQDSLLEEVCISISIQSPELLVSLFAEISLLLQDSVMLVDQMLLYDKILVMKLSCLKLNGIVLNLLQLSVETRFLIHFFKSVARNFVFSPNVLVTDFCQLAEASLSKSSFMSHQFSNLKGLFGFARVEQLELERGHLSS